MCFARRGFRVGVLKPFETGLPNDVQTQDPSDAQLLLESAQSNHPLDLVNPIRFDEPLAPFVAAERAGTSIDINIVLSAFSKIRSESEMTIVEGCGGLIVPITDQIDVAEFVCQLNLPILIVARAGLGTINHTGLTIQYARQKGIKIEGVILSGYDRNGSDTSHRDNGSQIERQFGVKVLAYVPRLSDVADARQRVELLANLWDEEGTTDRLVEQLKNGGSA